MDNQAYYDELLRRSMSGSRSSSQYKEETVSKERYRNAQRRYKINLKKALISGIIAGVILTGAVDATIHKVIPTMHEKFEVAQEIGNNNRSFDEEYISPNTHRTEDGNHYLFYDYDKIAKGLTEFGNKDFDMNLFYLLDNLDSKNVDEVLACVDDEDHNYRYSITDEAGEVHSRNFRYYLAQNNYYDPEITINDDVLLHDDKAYDKAIDNFRKTMKARISIEQSMSDVENAYNTKQQELEDMLNDHNMDGYQDNSKRR